MGGTRRVLTGNKSIIHGLFTTHSTTAVERPDGVRVEPSFIHRHGSDMNNHPSVKKKVILFLFFFYIYTRLPRFIFSF